MARSVVAISLTGSEYRSVRKHLVDAGFETVVVKSASDVEKLVARRGDVEFAILDTETDYDGSIAMYGVLRRANPEIYILMLVPARSLGRIGINRGIDPRDEYFTRPYSAESLRWRIEAMLIRGERPPVIEPERIFATDGQGSTAGLLPPDATGEVGQVGLVGGSAAQETAAPVAEGRTVATGGTGHREPGRPRGRIVIVFNPKGGVGKTTVSINLGSALQIRRGNRVLIVDCDTITGHVASSLGLGKPRTLADAWTEDAAGGAGATVEQIATIHGSGIGVLVLANSPMHTEVLEPRRVADTIVAARDSYDWVILDMHPDYGPLNRALFAQADRIIVPVTPDIPCIRAAIQFRDVATELGLHDRLTLVINRVNSGVATSDLQRVVDLPVLARIRSAGLLFVRAADEGKSVVERSPSAKVVGDIDEMAARLIESAGPDGGARDGGSHHRIGGPFRGLFDHRAARAPGQGPDSGST